jgi:hypothetical protein
MQTNVTIRLCASLLILAASTSWAADVGGGIPVVTDRVEHDQRQFDDVRFVMGAGHAMPWLEMYVGGGLVAPFREFDAQEVHASPDGRYFLAVSNRARSSLAYAVLDRQGRAVYSSAHAEPLQRYCVRGIASDWRWIDPVTPVARFEVATDSATVPASLYLKSVMVRGCDGKDLLLGKVHAKPAARSTIQNLRGLDPRFGGRTLTLIEGRRVVPPTAPVPAAPTER